MMKLKLRHRRLRKFRKIKSLRRQHSRCRYFHLTHKTEHEMNLPKVVVLTVAGISAESGIKPSDQKMDCGKSIALKMWQRQRDITATLNWFSSFIMSAVVNYNNPQFNLMKPIMH